MPTSYQPKVPHYTHQATELAEHWAAPGRAVLWEQGTGKSKLLIDRAAMLWDARRIDAVVVLAPGGVDRNWASDELPAHLPDRLWAVTCAHVWATSRAGTKWHAAAAKALLAHGGFPWLLMSYDAIMTTPGKTFLWKFLQQRRCLLVADESHHIKSPGAKRTIRALAAAEYAPYRAIATGTPVAQGPFDVYSQVKFVDSDFWRREGFGDFLSFKTHFGVWFRRRDCQELHGYDPGFDKLVGYQNLDQLERVLKKVSTRVLKDEVLDLPPKVYRRVYYDLTPEQVRLYERLKEDYHVETLSGRTVEANLAIVRLLRFQQICCGYVASMDENLEAALELLPGGNPLLKAVDAWAAGLGEKAIVWCRFTQDIELAAETLGKYGKTVKYYGGQSDDENFAASQAFKTSQEVRFIVANSAKGAGLTWHMAHHVAYYSNSFKLLDRLQSEDRAHRSGLDHSVDYTDFIAQMPGAPGRRIISHNIVDNLRAKRDIASTITGDELKEWI